LDEEVLRGACGGVVERGRINRTGRMRDRVKRIELYLTAPVTPQASFSTPQPL